MNTRIIPLAVTIGMLLPALTVAGDDCAGTRSTGTRYYTTNVRSSDVLTRTYVRTSPIYTDIRLAPVTTRNVLVRSVDSGSLRLVDVGNTGLQSVLRLDDNNRLVGDGDLQLDCGTETRGLGSTLAGLITVIEAAKKIKELLNSTPPDAPLPTTDEEELLKKLEPKIKELVEKALDERGIPKKNVGGSPGGGLIDNPELPVLQSAIVDESPTIKQLKKELADVKSRQEEILKALKEIKDGLPKK